MCVPRPDLTILVMVLKSDVNVSGWCNSASDSYPSYMHHPLLIIQLGR
jgi:hypothetical protein